MEGLLIGGVAFLVIGVFHPIVIKSEYYFGKRIWPIFLIVGIVFLVLAFLYRDNIFVSSILAILSFTCLWSIHEIIEQDARVKKGWFPSNPNRK